VVFEKDGEDQLNGSCERRISVTQSRKRKNIRHTIKRSQANLIGNILCTNCRLTQVTEEKFKGRESEEEDLSS